MNCLTLTFVAGLDDDSFIIYTKKMKGVIMMSIFTEFLTKIDHIDHRERTEEILNWVSTTFPQLKTEIKWNQPMFTDHGTYIIGFSTAKHHLSVAPERVAITKFSAQINKTGYNHTEQLFRIGWDKPVDYELLEEVIKFNIEDKADTTSFWRE